MNNVHKSNSWKSLKLRFVRLMPMLMCGLTSAEIDANLENIHQRLTCEQRTDPTELIESGILQESFSVSALLGWVAPDETPDAFYLFSSPSVQSSSPVSSLVGPTLTFGSFVDACSVIGRMDGHRMTALRWFLSCGTDGRLMSHNYYYSNCCEIISWNGFGFSFRRPWLLTY